MQDKWFLITKKNKNHTKGEKQAGRQQTTGQANMKHTRHKTTDLHRTPGGYIGRLTRETQVEQLKQ